MADVQGAILFWHHTTYPCSKKAGKEARFINYEVKPDLRMNANAMVTSIIIMYHHLFSCVCNFIVSTVESVLQ